MTTHLLPKVTVLLVEDAPDNLTLLSDLLKDLYTVRLANNGEKAIAFAQSSTPPDLILMAIKMPGLSGYEVCKVLKAGHATCNIPIIFLSDKTDTDDEKIGFDLGAADFITKPFNPSIIRARVATQLQVRASITALKQAELQLQQHRDHLAQLIQKQSATWSLSEAQLKSLFNTLIDLVSLKNLQGVYLACNPMIERLFGAPESYIVGKTDHDLIEHDLADLFRANDLEAIHATVPRTYEEWVTFADDGHRALLATTKTGVRDAQGNLIGLLSIGRDITERKQIEEALRARESRLQTMFDRAIDGILIFKPDGTIVSFNESFASMHGYSIDEFKDITIEMFDTPETARLAPERRRQIIAGESLTFEIEHYHRDGHILLLEVSTSQVLLDGECLIQCFHRDITDRRQFEVALRASQASLSSIFDATPDAILISSADGTITMANQQAENMFGYTAEELLGQTIEILVPNIFHSNHSALRDKFATSSDARRMGSGLAVKALRKDGSECDVEVSLSRIVTEQGVFFASALRDISERKKAQDKINELAFFDQLTGLPNRALLLDRIKQAMTVSSRSGSFGALIILDLDNFKVVNDTLGHLMGDLLLKEVAQRLIGCIREGDTVARVDGDEFVVMLDNLGQNVSEAALQAEVTGKKIITALNQTYQFNGVDLISTASIGATLFSDKQISIEDLLKQADLAMYKSKNAGRNTLHFFDPAMEIAVMQRVALENDLREAITRKQFLLYFQAQMDDDRLTGAEVLVRWQHPQRGIVSPAEFIPLAEETGLILPLGQWVLETACSQLAQWSARPEMAHLILAVNVSARQFHEAEFVANVLAALNKSGANPNRLKIELTESILISKVDDIAEKMFALKAKGVYFSLDDFGTGYSSLNYLKKLPLDQLKIDQSFVRDVLTDPSDASIARTVIMLAHNLDLSVIAEGVETQGQKDFLTQSGCHAFQGYFFSRPVPLEGFEDFARRV